MKKLKMLVSVLAAAALLTACAAYSTPKKGTGTGNDKPPEQVLYPVETDGIQENLPEYILANGVVFFRFDKDGVYQVVYKIKGGYRYEKRLNGTIIKTKDLPADANIDEIAAQDL